MLLVLKHLLRINPERLGVGRSHEPQAQRSCSCRPPALGPASPRTPDPPQPAAGLAASPSDCHRRPLLCLPTPHRRPWPWAEQQPHRGRTGSTDADAGHRPGSFVLSAAAGEPELLQHGGEHDPFLRAAGWICILQEQAVAMERGDGGPAPPCFSPRRAGPRGDHQNQSLEPVQHRRN